MALGQSRFLRQAELRRKLSDGQDSWLERVRVFLCWPVVIGFLFWAGASWTVLSGRARMPYSLNESIRQPVLARVNFERVNENRTAELLTKAQQDVPNYFRLNKSLVDAVRGEIRDLHAAVKSADSFEKYKSSPANHWSLDAVAFTALKGMTLGAGLDQFQRDLDEAIRRLIDEEMVERADIDREIRSTASDVELDRGTGSFVAWPKEKLTYAVNSEHVDALARSVPRDLFVPEIRPAITAIVHKAVEPSDKVLRPIYVYDEELTKAKLKDAASLPPVKDAYRAGDRLVKPGILDGEAIALLKAEHDEYLRQRSSNPELRSGLLKERMGLIGVVMLIVAGFAIYGYRAQPRAMTRTPRAVGVATLLLLLLMLDRFVLIGIGTSTSWSVACIVMAAAIMTISYSQMFAIGATGALALLIVVSREAPLGAILVFFTVASVTILCLKEIRTRLKMVEVGGITAIMAGLSTFLVGLTAEQPFRLLVKDSAIAALAALTGLSIVLVLLPLIERAFRITTSLTLLEWADTSTPLLRQLIESAPGTWQHSHLLGSMAETAAEEVGANGLLVRVGAYYHDIGKTAKPNYFVENQATKTSAHRGLAPTMSLLVILAHVKDGLALAREHGLPPALHPFIAEHHGTTVVKYFHSMAEREAKASGRDEREVSETEFRYPGPKPRSVETAILMICDGVEGAVRALAEPTPSRIESVVHDLISKRLMDGQFDDCDITLKELARVEQSLIRSLCSIHHGRIAYPTAPSNEPERPTPDNRPGVKVGA
ncbi:MAG: HDIG domain-containing protein [Planctomycetes bacterium]|nr:HDIG domain-containing protein [Planctomycetota bacterium]